MPNKIKTVSDEDELIIGISTQLKDYRLCFFLNKMLYLGLSRINDLVADRPGGDGLMHFSCYLYEEPGHFLSFFLIANRTPDGILVPELRQADYLLVINGPFSNESRERFMSTIKQIPDVLAGFTIDLSKYKKAEELLSELEFHVMAYKRLQRESGH